MNMIAFCNWITGLAESSVSEISSVAISDFFIDNVLQNSEIKGQLIKGVWGSYA